jgi:poly-beta-hydroxyalkanoate depolymerase
MVGNRDVEVQEKPVVVTPFGTLLHFKKDIDAPHSRIGAPSRARFCRQPCRC